MRTILRVRDAKSAADYLTQISMLEKRWLRRRFRSSSWHRGGLHVHRSATFWAEMLEQFEQTFALYVALNGSNFAGFYSGFFGGQPPVPGDFNCSGGEPDPEFDFDPMFWFDDILEGVAGVDETKLGYVYNTAVAQMYLREGVGAALDEQFMKDGLAAGIDLFYGECLGEPIPNSAGQRFLASRGWTRAPRFSEAEHRTICSEEGPVLIVWDRWLALSNPTLMLYYDDDSEKWIITSR